MRNKNSTVAGLLFLLGFAGGGAAALLHPLQTAADPAQTFAANENKVLAAVFGILLMGFACAGIAVALYPRLREKHPGMALGAVVFRGIEGVFHLLIANSYLGMLALARSAAGTSLQALLPLSLRAIESYVLVATMAWGLVRCCTMPSFGGAG